MQSTFRRETRPDRVPLLLSSVSDSECFPFPPAPSGFLPAPQTPPAARSVKFPHSKSCPLLSSSAPVSPAGRRSLAHQCASRCPTLGPKDTIRQIAHAPGRPVPRKPTSNPVPCFRSPASPLWFWCHKQTGSLARCDPKENKSCLQTTRDSHRSNSRAESSPAANRAATQYKSASSARRDTSSTPPAISSWAHTRRARRPANTNRHPPDSAAHKRIHPLPVRRVRVNAEPSIRAPVHSIGQATMPTAFIPPHYMGVQPPSTWRPARRGTEHAASGGFGSSALPL